MTGPGRLPVVIPPATDERLSSWLARMASCYALTVPEFLAELGLPGRDVFELEWRLSEGEGALIAARTGLVPEAVQAMTFGEMVPDARLIIGRKDRHHCPLCRNDVQRKSMAIPWIFRCPVHSTDLLDATGTTLPEVLGEGQITKLESLAATGATVLNAWAYGAEEGGLGAPETLAFLTARHRRASPPNVSEQPRLSLGARRDYHTFLTTPIIRQALAVVVPEYDRVAPLLTKPVRPGLHALAQGSLLQAFALTVGIGRIVEDPVARAIDVLLVSDADGKARLNDALRSWPLSPRRRISARLWRTLRDERDLQISAKPTKRRQSHKYRRVQSQENRSRIS